MATINVTDAGGAEVALERPLPPGRAAAGASKPVALSTEDLAALNAVTAALTPLATAAGQASGNTTLADLLAGQADLASDAGLAAIATLLTGITSALAPAATAANQNTGNGALANILAALGPVATAANQKPAMFWNGATGPASALAAGAVFTGAARDVGVAAGAAHSLGYFNAFFLADQSSTAAIEASNDGVTWYALATAPLAAGSPLILNVPVMTRYHRAKVTNGSVAQGLLWVNSAYAAA